MQAVSKSPVNIPLFCLFALVIFLSRVPFLTPGYGESDAWRVANTARDISLQGHYSASRHPGHFVQEMACSFFWRGGDVALNGLTAVFSVVAAVFFALILKEISCREYLLASLALAFTPVIYIKSCESIDYIWSLALFLASIYYFLIERPRIAGVCLGLAIGCRLTMIFMVFPVGILSLKSGRIKDFIIYAALSIIVGGAAFIPYIDHYGWSIFFSWSAHAKALQTYPSLSHLFKMITLDIWGSIGWAVILITVLVTCLMPSRFREPDPALRVASRFDQTAWLTGFFLFFVLFFLFPTKAFFLTPCIPFVIIFLAQTLDRSIFIIVCLALVFSSFIHIDRAGAHRGPIFENKMHRAERIEKARRIISKVDQLSGKSIVVCGSLSPLINNISAADTGKVVKYITNLSKPQIDKYRKRGFKVYCLRGVDEMVLKRYGIDPNDYGVWKL